MMGDRDGSGGDDEAVNAGVSSDPAPSANVAHTASGIAAEIAAAAAHSVTSSAVKGGSEDSYGDPVPPAEPLASEDDDTFTRDAGHGGTVSGIDWSFSGGSSD